MFFVCSENVFDLYKWHFYGGRYSDDFGGAKTKCGQIFWNFLMKDEKPELRDLCNRCFPKLEDEDHLRNVLLEGVGYDDRSI